MNDLPYFTEPKNDNERLLNYQYDYLVNGNASALDDMYLLGKTVALKMIGTQGFKNPHIKNMRVDIRAQKAHDAITYIVARYFKVKTFCIKKSFTAYLFLRVRKELFYKRKVDDIITYEGLLNSEEEIQEIKDKGEK